ncbi:MAG TPA: hypothetical protein VNH44_00935, partial [Micropepsaceae bacterium]|nr:hypothetical protein [Micropepsaceae bacterium]
IGIFRAASQIFFEQACCGLLPHLPELRDALEDADTFGETWQVLSRAGQLSRSFLGSKVHFHVHAEDGDAGRASVLLLEAQQPQVQIGNGRPPVLSPMFKCSAVQYGPLGLLGGLIGGWSNAQTQSFECAELVVEANRPHWILLDGDPVRFDGPVEFSVTPGAIQTFYFGPRRQAADNGTHLPSSSAAPVPKWNYPAGFHVAMTENRDSGDRKQEKQV